MRTLHVTHVFHQPQDRHVHHFGHANGLFHDHPHQFLGRGHHDDAVHRQRLKYCQGHISGSRRHVDEHIIHLSPGHILPELLQRAGDHRTSPDYRIVFLFHQQVHGHHLDAGGGLCRIQPLFISPQIVIIYPEHLRNAGACNIRIQDTHTVSLSLHGHRTDARYQGFTHAALTADHGDHFFYMAARIRRHQKALFFLLFTCFTAAAAVTCTLTHNSPHF